MELSAIMEIISTLGFPIACVLAMGFFIWKIYKQSVERENKLMIEIGKAQAVNEQAISTIALYAERLTHIEDNVAEIKNDVILIKDKVNQ